MSKTKPIKILVALITIISFMAVFFDAPTTHAATCNNGEEIPAKTFTDGDPEQFCKDRGSDYSSIKAQEDPALTSAKKCESSDGCVSDLFQRYFIPLINLLSAAVGLVVIAMIIVGGIQYSSAGADPNKIKAAKRKITNALIALVSYIFLYSFLQWIVPGGLF